MRAEAVERRLASLPEVSRQGKRINGLHRLLSCPRIWEQAYEAIAPNKGALTPGIDPENTLDGFSLERMNGLIAKVREKTYRFAPVRRQYIPKANGKLRPLGIPSADDKLVQAAVKLVLERIYEPVFSRNSHGFRPGYSCHTALEHIRKAWTGVVWLVEVDVVGFFDNIDHDILLGLLRKRIDDEDFLGLIKGMLKAGHMEDWTWNATYSGAPQGGIVSPLLANVYLHELDEFMTTYKARFDRGTVRRHNPEHKRLRSLLSDRRRRVERLGKKQETEKERLLGEIRDLQKALLRLPNPKDPFDPGYRRLLYVRYADDFLIGVIGPKQDARDIMEAVRSHLKDQLNLEVSDEKSGIAAASEGASFLGYTVKARTYDRIQRIRRKDSGWTMLRRDPSRTIQLHVPHEKLAAFVKRRRLGNYYTMCGEPRNELKNSSDLEVITRYGLELRGLAEYYKLAALWKEELSRVRRIWWFSLMKTLGHKHKCSVACVIREILDHQGGEYGVRYETKDGQKFRQVFRLKHVSDSATTYRTVDEIRDYPFLGMSRTDLLDRLRAKQCESCGLTDVPLEIHHARRLSDISHQSLAAQLVAARRRKRLALCQPCHRALHNGTLTARLRQMKAEAGAG